jgi:hypothetical protein
MFAMNKKPLLITLLLCTLYLGVNAQRMVEQEIIKVPLLDSIIFQSDSRIILLLDDIENKYKIYTNERIIKNALKEGVFSKTDSMELTQVLHTNTDRWPTLMTIYGPEQYNSVYHCLKLFMESGLLYVTNYDGTRIISHSTLAVDCNENKIRTWQIEECGYWRTKSIRFECGPPLIPTKKQLRRKARNTKPVKPSLTNYTFPIS